MFGLDESSSGLKEWEDKRELHEKIYVEANGGCDINGEWEFSGSYSVRVSPDVLGNFCSYSGRISRGFKRKGRWRVSLNVVGGGHGLNRIQVSILNKTAPSIKQARKLIVQTILDYEQTSHFKEEIAPKIYAEDFRTPIVKEVNGELLWIATTFDDPWNTLKGKSGFYSDEKPLGSGEFYYRKRKWDFEYARKEDGTKDYDAEPEKIYLQPFYGGVSVSYHGMSGGGERDEELKKKINEAIFDLNDSQVLKKQFIRYLDLKRI